jgi:D-alanyl-lipoteichoic acid acyltransferase DltB (MBOAT superfamily)
VLFHSLPYAVFLPLCALAYWTAPARHRWVLLVATGAAFLGSAGRLHLAIAVAMTAVNFAAALALEKWTDTRRGTGVLWLVLLLDVAALGAFKYLGLLFSPLGISYYTFQLIGYNLEVHWGRERAERHLGRFAASILFFPKLVAGPIERPHRFLAQLGAERPFRAAEVAAGIRQIGWGLFKKCVIADRVALFVDLVYKDPRALTGLPLLVGVAGYVVQIYNDFSGYTDIALGSARVLGIELGPNFDHPFSARSVSDFWRRWHISLSSWTNDYIFKPLSTIVSLKTKLGKAGIVGSLLITFLVLGVWHGPSFGFVVFGLLHGAAVSFEVLTRRPRGAALDRLPAKLADGLRVGATVTFYAFSCVFFRARKLSDAIYIVTHAFRGLGHLGGLQVFAPLVYHLGVLVVLVALIGLVRWRVADRLAEQPTWARWSIYEAVAISILLFGLFEINQFVYVQF